MQVKPVESAWFLWGEKVGMSVRQGWQSLQDASNDLVKRIVSSYRRFAKGKPL